MSDNFNKINQDRQIQQAQNDRPPVESKKTEQSPQQKERPDITNKQTPDKKEPAKTGADAGAPQKPEAKKVEATDAKANDAKANEKTVSETKDQLSKKDSSVVGNREPDRNKTPNDITNKDAQQPGNVKTLKEIPVVGRRPDQVADDIKSQTTVRAHDWAKFFGIKPNDLTDPGWVSKVEEKLIEKGVMKPAETEKSQKEDKYTGPVAKPLHEPHDRRHRDIKVPVDDPLQVERKEVWATPEEADAMQKDINNKEFLKRGFDALGAASGGGRGSASKDAMQRLSPRENKAGVKQEKPTIDPEIEKRVNKAFTQEKTPQSSGLYDTTQKLIRANAGERLAADALSSDGHVIISFKPRIEETNQPGIDIVTVKDGKLYLIDNKALSRKGNVNDVSALTTNFPKNLETVKQDLRTSLNNTNLSPAERKVLETALNAAEKSNYVKAVTNANIMMPDGKITSDVSKNLKGQGFEFINVFKPREKK